MVAESMFIAVETATFKDSEESPAFTFSDVDDVKAVLGLDLQLISQTPTSDGTGDVEYTIQATVVYTSTGGSGSPLTLSGMIFDSRGNLNTMNQGIATRVRTTFATSASLELRQSRNNIFRYVVFIASFGSITNFNYRVNSKRVIIKTGDPVNVIELNTNKNDAEPGGANIFLISKAGDTNTYVTITVYRVD